MSHIPDHLKTPHLSAWALGLTIAGCGLSMFSPIAINKSPQWAITGTATGAALSVAGWVMSSQSEKASKLQAKLEEQTEAIFLRRLGMESELDKLRDAVYFAESQQAIAQSQSPRPQQQLPPRLPPEEYETEQPRGQLAVLERDDIALKPQILATQCDDMAEELVEDSDQKIDRIIQDLAICRTSILLCSQPGTGKTTLTLAWLWATVANTPETQFFIIGQKRDNWLGLGSIKGVLTVVNTEIDELIEKVSKVCEILKERCQTPEEDRDFENKPVRLIFDDYTATFTSISAVGGKTLKEFISNIAFLITVGREFNVTLYVSAHSFNLKQLGLEGADIRNCLILMGLGFKSYTERGESGGFDSVDSVLNNQYIVKPGTGIREKLISEYKKLKAISLAESKQLLFCTLGGVSLSLLSDLRWVKNENVVPRKHEIDLKKANIPEVLEAIDPLNPMTWQSVDYPDGLQWLPQHEAGVYAVFVEGYQNPLYIGQSKDLWRRWNNKGDWEHHVKKHLESIENVGVKIAFYITKGWEEQKRLSLESELQAKYKSPWNGTNQKQLPEKIPSEVAQAVYDFLLEVFNGEPIPARDCYRKSSLRTQYGLNAETTEQVFDELQEFGFGQKLIKEVNGFRSVNFLPVQRVATLLID